MKIYQLLLGCVCMVLLGTAQAQPTARLLQGRVLNEKGEPLAGASIRQLPAGSSVSADAQGYFQLPGVARGQRLLVSFTGYQSAEITVRDTSLLQVRLALQSTTLANVTVSTGYQQLPRERMTGSYDVLDEALINRATGTNVLARIEGITSGLYANKQFGETNLFVRGLSTLATDRTAPLIIVDNFPFEGNLQAIHPADVASITVLKDAAATSVWGATAGNGVIVITTRKGSAQQKPRWQLSSNLTWQQRPDVRRLPWASAGAFLEIEDSLFSRGYYNTLASNVTNRPVLSEYIEDRFRHRSGLLSDEALAQRRQRYAQTNFLQQAHDQLYQTALLQQHHLQVQGGQGGSQYLISMGYDDNRLAEQTHQYRRYSLMARWQLALTPRTDLQLASNQSWQHTDQPVVQGLQGLVPGSGRGRYYPYAALLGPDGEAAALPREHRMGYLDTTGGGLLLPWSYVPLADRQLHRRAIRRYDQLTRFSLQHRFSKAVSADLMYQLQTGMGRTEVLQQPASFGARHLINQYSQRSGTGIVRQLPEGGILDRNTSSSYAHSARLQVQLRQQWTDWQLAGLAGAEIRQAVNRSNGERLYGYSTQNLSVAAVNHQTLFPIWGNLRAPAAIPSGVSLGATDNRFVSAFANASLEWKQRFQLSGSLRKDASNLFGVATNMRGIPLWSAGLGWQMHREAWMRDAGFSLLKWRTTYGVSGNLDPTLSALATIAYSNASLNPVNLPFASLQNPPNDRLRWERVAMFNIGVDFALQSGWLSGSVEYYRKKATDLIAITPTDPTIGVFFQRLNAAHLSGQGIDLQLNNRVGKGRWQLESQLLLHWVTNKVSKFLPLFVSFTALPGTGTNPVTLQGYQAYGLFSYQWAGLQAANGAPQGVVDGKESTDYNRIINPAAVGELVFHGTTRAPFYGSWRPALRVGSLQLSALFMAEWGHWFRRPALSYSGLADNWLAHQELEQRWRQPGDERRTQVPAFAFPLDQSRDQFYSLSAATAERAAHIRWQDVRVEWQDTAPLKGRKMKYTVFVYASQLPVIWRASKAVRDPLYPEGFAPPMSVAAGLQLNW